MLRLGLVGTARWAVETHGAGAVAHPEVDLVTVWGRDPGKTAGAAAALGVTGSSSYADLLDAVDAVVFAVPPDVQAPLALEAGRAGKHLLLEKPVSLDPAVADELAACDVATVVFLTRLWSGQTVEWLDRNAGPWIAGRCSYVASLPADFLVGSPWRAEHGALWDIGPHALSVLEAVLGQVVTVAGTRGQRDLVHLSFEHAAGAVSSAELTLTAPQSAAGFELSLWGEGGRVVAPAGGADEHPHPATAALTALAARARGEQVRGPDAAYGAHITHVLAAAEQALSTGHRTPVRP